MLKRPPRPQPVTENVGPVFRKADVRVANQPARRYAGPTQLARCRYEPGDSEGPGLGPLFPSGTLSVDHVSNTAPAGVRDGFGTVSVDFHGLDVGVESLIFQLVAALD